MARPKRSSTPASICSTWPSIDQHFLRRNRQERLLGVLNEHPEMIGLGIDEGTALVVEGDHLRVMGQSEVVVCKSAGEQAPWVQSLKAGEEVDLIYPHTQTPDVLVLEHRRPEVAPIAANRGYPGSMAIARLAGAASG